MSGTNRAGMALAEAHTEALAALEFLRPRMSGDPRLSLLWYKLDWVRRMSGRDLGGVYSGPLEALRGIRDELPALRSYAEVAGMRRAFVDCSVHSRLDAIERALEGGLTLVLVEAPRLPPEPEPDVAFAP